MKKRGEKRGEMLKMSTNNIYSRWGYHSILSTSNFSNDNQSKPP